MGTDNKGPPQISFLQPRMTTLAIVFAIIGNATMHSADVEHSRASIVPFTISILSFLVAILLALHK